MNIRYSLAVLSFAVLSTVPSRAEEQAVAYLSPNGSVHSEMIVTGVRLTGDARKTCTQELWVYPLTRDQQSLIAQYGGNNGRQTFCIVSGNDKNKPGRVSMWMNGDSSYSTASITSASQVPLNQWTHIALVMDGDVWRLYINGELDGETSGHSAHLLDATSADGFVIGNTRVTNPNGGANAYFAEVRVWKCARTQAEIKSAMNTRLQDAWKLDDLVGYWPLADGADAYAANGNGLRNGATMDYNFSTPLALWGWQYAKGSRVSWVTSDLPVTGLLPGDSFAVRNECWSNDATNAVDTQISAAPTRFTLMAWCFVSRSTPGKMNYLFGKMRYANGRLQFYENNGNLVLWMGGGIGGRTNESFQVGNVMMPHRWTHVALVKDGPIARVYVDGQLKGEGGGFTLDPLDANLHFCGYKSEGASGAFYGAMKNVGFWGKALTEKAIRDRMALLPRPDEPGLLGYWPADDGTGTSVRNLKTGALSGIAMPNGEVLWLKGANMPIVDGETPRPGMAVVVR